MLAFHLVSLFTLVLLNLGVGSQILAQLPSNSTSDIEQKQNESKEKVEQGKEASLVECADYFKMFTSPTIGYARYLDNNTCTSIDYPSNWYVDNNSIQGFDVILTDGKSSSIIISQRPALQADNRTSFTLEDVKRAIIMHDTSIPNLANIPSLYEFPTSVIGDGKFLDNLPSIRADAFTDLTFIKIIRNLFATVYNDADAGNSKSKEMYVLTINRNESQIDPSILRHVLDSIHILH